MKAAHTTPLMVLALVLASGVWLGCPSRARDDGQEESGATSLARSEQREEVWNAFLSVYFHTARPRPDSSRWAWKPYGLERSASILRDYKGFGGSAVRRRAAARIGAAALAPGAPTTFERALVTLGLPETFLGSVRSPALPLGNASPPELEQDVQESLDALDELDPTIGANFKSTCCTGFDFCEVEAATSADSTTAAYFQLTVRRPVDGIIGLEAAMDPQRWDECVPSHFPDAYRTADACPLTSSTTPPEHAMPPGSSWKGAFYERFVADPSGSTWFRNYLDIEWFHFPGRQYCFDYDLCSPIGSIESQVPGKAAAPGGIDVDKGYVFAQPLPGSPADTSVLTGLKYLRFSRSDLELWTWNNLSMEAAVDLIASVGACCGAPSGSASCPSSAESCSQAPDLPGSQLPEATCD